MVCLKHAFQTTTVAADVHLVAKTETTVVEPPASAATSARLARDATTSSLDTEDNVPAAVYLDSEPSASATVNDPMEPAPDYTDNNISSSVAQVIVTVPSSDYDEPSAEQLQRGIWTGPVVSLHVPNVPDPDYELL